MTAIAVTIAGSDSGGGAGIQADLKTFSALGVYGASVITALTAQNTQGVTGIHDVPAGFRHRADRRGVLRSRRRRGEDRHAVAAAGDRGGRATGLARHGSSNKIVLDPVMVATSGDRLLAPDAVDALAQAAYPARAGDHAQSAGSGGAARRADRAQRERDARRRRERLLALGAQAVLIKGGHGTGAESVDLLIEPNDVDAPRRRAHRHQEHPRHRLHAVVGDRRRARQGPDARRGGARRQGLCHRRDRRRRHAQDRLTATGRCIIFTRWW